MSEPDYVAWTDALLIVQRGFDEYKRRYKKWWAKMDGTPMLNDLAVVIAETISKELCYPHRSTPAADEVTVPREPTRDELVRAIVAVKMWPADDEPVPQAFVTAAHDYYCAVRDAMLAAARKD